MQYQSQADRKRRSWKQDLCAFLARVGISAVVFLIVWNYVMAAEINRGNSMYPKICDGDLVIYTIYNKKQTYRDDVLVCRYGGETRCGRVIALEGDTVEIKGGVISVNGSALPQQNAYGTLPDSAYMESGYTVPEGSVFLLNDFRSANSGISGDVGFSDVMGRVFLIVRRRGF